MSKLDPGHLFAALSGPFEPLEAFAPKAPAATAGDEARLVMAASQLAEACDTSPFGADQRWLMRTSVRHTLLRSLDSEQLTKAVSQRRASQVDQETADLLAVLLNEPPLSQADIEAIIGAANSAAWLERAIVALDRAGDIAHSHELLPAARAALTELQRAQARERVVERGFVGREREIKAIEDWMAAPVQAAPVTCLFMSGAPGIGKSTLLAEALRRCHEDRQPLLLRLDFDRAGLDVRDLLGLTMEAARQLGEQMGSRARDLADARLEAGYAPDHSVKSQLTLRQMLPEILATKLGEAVTASGRPVLVVLDTLEVLRGRGETHPASLFAWLDQLLDRGVRPMSVLAAGRGDALDGLRLIDDDTDPKNLAEDRIPRVKRLALGGLDETAAKALLGKLGAPQPLWPELLELANGHPLKLRLGAEIARRIGLDRLPRGRRKEEVDAAFLYRFLLSRIDEPDLQRLAHPGLIVRRINATLIREVLAPQLKLDVSEARAQELLQQLAEQHWLVEPDPGAPGFLKHRSDMRMLLLPLLYRAAPAQAARIDAAAMRWFAALPDQWAQVEALYHGLQLSRRGRAAPSVPIELAALFDDEMLAELPPPAADLVRSTQGGRTSQFRGPASAGKPWGDDSGITRELLSLIDRQDWLEGRFIVRQIVDAGGIDLRSLAADAIRTFLWRSGQWALARRWLSERDRFDPSDSDIVGLPDPLALARLEMRATFDPEDLRRRAPWRDMEDRLRTAALAAGDKVARHGALALVLASMQQPIRLAARDSREPDPVAAAYQRWLGADGDDLRLAEEAARNRFDRLGLLQARFPKGSVLASLTPYVAFVHNLSVAEDKRWMSDAAQHTVKALLDRGSTRFPSALFSPQSVPVSWLSDVGLLAEWAEVAAFARRDADLLLIAQAAERWRRTMAGNWSIGQRRGEWRKLPRPDETLSEQARTLLRKPVEAAQQELQTWHDCLPGLDLLGQVRRRLAAALDEASVTDAVADSDVITTRLLARGAPAALAPALAAQSIHRRRRSRYRAGYSPTPSRKESPMDNESRLETLHRRLTPSMEAAVRSAVADGRLPRSAASVLPAASLAALSSGQSLESLAQSGQVALAGLEAIVQITGRPPLLVRNDAVVMEPMPELPAETPGLIRGVEKWLPSVGRIEFINNEMSWGGTGWVIDHRQGGALVITNRHVAKIVGRRKADGTAVFVRAPSGPRYGAAIDFREEVDSPIDNNSRTAALTRFEYLADDTAADVALLWIEAADFPLPSPFELHTGAVARDDLVALIGYPAYDPRNDASAQAQYFRDLYEVKRFAPGKILQSPDQGLLTYDCTSLGGNSGSPLIRLDDGKIVGLHFSGLYGVANTAVSADTLSRLLAGERPVSVKLKELHQEAAQDGHHRADHFQNRSGFNPAFLGAAAATPWPGLPEALTQDLANPSDQPDEPHELRYTHFGVKYSARQKLPLITAVNIDGEFSRRIKRGNDRWFTDGRIPADIQLTAQNFKDAEIDRGHMVRREDPNWGDANDAQQANDDTFHYVNAAAQHARLNQGKTLWQGLENYILDSARTHGFKACVFTGPVLRDPQGDEEEIEVDGAIAPLEFWKLVATLDKDGKALHATAYVLSQGRLIRALLEKRSRREALEGVVLGAYRTFQVAVADLAEATGYDFSAYVGADPLAQAGPGQEAIGRGEPVYLPIGELADLVL